MNGWIAVDLDGTLAEYHGWKGVEHIGEPVPAMVARVRTWLAEGKEVRIFTARVAEPDTSKRIVVVRHIEEWCVKHVGQLLRITNVKDYGMIELWDDRCIQVRINTGVPVGQ